MVDRSVPSFLALSCIGVIATGTAPAMAEDVAASAVASREQATTISDDQQLSERDTITVQAREAQDVESPKSTAPLLDTPQTVTVISDQVLRKQNLLTLRDALSTIPGITFGAGEGGGGYGDSINLRGYSANNDLTIDGIRDSAQYSRTDPFNLQQIEVYNGANSVFNGSGSVGGTINLVSKAPQAEALTIVQGGIGTDGYYRGTADANLRPTEMIAVRLNAMIHRNEVPGRDVEKFKRWGVAPSVTIGIGSPTSLTLAYVHQRDDNTPLFGVPYNRGPVTDGILPGVDRSDYYGYRNLDEQEITVDRLTAVFRHEFSDSVSVRNLTRWQRVGQDSITSAPQGTFCLATTGRQPVGASGADTAGLACPAGLAPGFWQPSGPRGLVRNQENQLLANQVDLRVVSGEAGGVRNTLNVGGSLVWEDYQIENASLPRTATGAAVTLPLQTITNPTGIYTGPFTYTVTGRSKSETTNRAIYAFDTLEIGPMFELNGGIRWERNEATFKAIPLLSYPPGTAALTPLQLQPQRSDESLFSYRGGVVFKPVPEASLYAAYGNTKTPSSATVRLGCGVPTTGTAADPCATAPEKGRSYEIGAKLELFGRLQLTAALFRNERSNFRVPSNDPALPVGLQVLDGRARVDGVALGATGNITPEWQIFANYTYLDSSVRQSVSQACLENPGRTGCGNSAAVPDPQRGNELIQTPKHSGSLFTSYRLPFGLDVGYGFTYTGSFATNQSVLANAIQYRSDDWMTHRLFASYVITEGLTAQVNVSNLFDEKYLVNIRNNIAATGGVSGGWAMPADRRQATFSLFYSF